MLVQMNVFFHLKVNCSETLCAGFSKHARFLIRGLDPSYLLVNTNVEISCLNWNNLGIINCIKILAVKSNSKGLKSL